MVEWKKLGEIANITIGEFVHRDKQNPKAKYPVYNGGTTYTGFYEYYNNTGNKIVISARGYAGFVNRVFDNYWAGNSSYSIDINNSKVLWHYVYYYLKNEQYNIMSMQQKGGGLAAISKKQVQELLIPIPSLSEQSRIVSILDTFTSSISNLKQQIEERRKQYEYERNLLLDLEGKEGVEMKTLGEVANFVKDRIEASFLNSQNYVSVENLLKDKAGRIDSENVPFKGNWSCYKHGDVLIGNIRPYLRKIWLADRKGGTNGDVLIIRPNEFILPQFLYCVLASEKFFEYYNQTAKGGKMPRGEKSRALSYIIPLPPLSTQSRIVSILDTFEQSISNLEEQLAMREKQYEYYRNQLLTFEGEEERGKT